MNANFHTHTTRCHHASGTEREYVEAAIANGIKILGFSDHTPYPFPGEGYVQYMRMAMHELEDYVNTVLALRDEYRREIEIHLGLEVEYYPDFFPALLKETANYPIEYFLLAQHNLGNGEITETYTYNPPTEDPERLKRYCSQLIDGMNTGCFTYLAHPDILSYVGDPQIYAEQMRSLCRNAKAANIPLELNFLGIRENRRYPNEHFWKIAGEIGCDVVFGLDAHSPASFQHTDAERKAMELVDRFNLKLLKDITLVNPYA